MNDSNNHMMEHSTYERLYRLRAEAEKQRLLRAMDSDKPIDPITRTAIVSTLVAGVIALVGLNG